MGVFSYITCTDEDIALANLIKDHLKSSQNDVVISTNSECQFHYQSLRTQILDCDVFIAIVTAQFVKQEIHLYQLAQAFDLGKKTFIVQEDLTQIPPPFQVLRSIEWHNDLTVLAEKVRPVEYASISTELQLKDIQSTLIHLCEGINKIQNPLTRRKKVSKRQFPCDIRKVARRYQDVIAYPIIRQLGRYLDLEEDELEEVERFSEYGTKEAFWQAIRIWLEKTESVDLTVGTIIKALKECDVDLAGKQMSNAHRKILKSKMAYLVDNIQIEPMLPFLVSRSVLCEVTKAYVSAPKTIDQKVNRLIDILMTKEEGLLSFCQVLEEAGFKFVAEEISASLDQTLACTSEKPVAVLRPSSESSATMSDSDSSYVKHMINEYRLSSSSMSSVFSRRDSTSTKIVAIAPRVVNPVCKTDKTVKKVKKVNKSNSKYEEKGLKKDASRSEMKRKGEKGAHSLNCVNSCTLS